MEIELNTDSELAQAGAVRFMEAPALRRGMRTPRATQALFAVLGIVGLLVASLFGLRAYDAVANAPERYAQSITEAISSGPGLQLPTLNSFVDSDNAGIKEALLSSGIEILDVNQVLNEEEVDEFSLDLVKIPSGMSYDLAEDLFKSSFRRANTTDALQYLAGSWRLNSYTENGVDLKIKYSDFQSGNIDEAISAAIAAQGWSDATFGETGIDQSENTYQNGSIQINEKTYTWTVSACPLKDVYSISGLPDNSYYIGVRLLS